MEESSCVPMGPKEPVYRSSSLIKRLQLTPKHKPSQAERMREEERMAKGRELGEWARDQPEECGEWGEWTGWSSCEGECGKEGWKGRSRRCKCQR